jgi:FlaA1/EpsC-like NDP-sugar epimerase
MRMEVSTDQRYSQGNARIIRLVSQRSPVADLTLAEAAEAHYQRSMAGRFEKVRTLGAQHREKGKIAFYGAAELADLILANTNIDRNEIAVIFDTDASKHGITFNGLTVHSPQSIPAINPAVIVMLSAAETAIRETIEKTGFTGQIIGWSEL